MSGWWIGEYTYLNLADAARGLAEVERDGWAEGSDILDLRNVDGLGESISLNFVAKEVEIDELTTCLTILL